METQTKTSLLRRLFGRGNAAEDAQTALINCGADEIARFLEIISRQRKVTVNIYISQTTGNITANNICGVNTVKGGAR